MIAQLTGMVVRSEGNSVILDVGGVGREAAEKVRSGGGGDGKSAMSAEDRATADVDGGGVPGAYL